MLLDCEVLQRDNSWTLDTLHAAGLGQVEALIENMRGPKQPKISYRLEKSRFLHVEVSHAAMNCLLPHAFRLYSLLL